MASINQLLGMIATETIEENSKIDYLEEQQTREELPPIPYSLEFIKNQDSSYEWVE